MENQTEIQIKAQTAIATTANVNITNLEALNEVDLQKYEPQNIDLDTEYWSPETEGDNITVIFSHIVENDLIPDYNDRTKMVEKDCAYFMKQITVGGKKIFKATACGASRLVSYMTKTGISGNVYLITYLGKKKNKTNNNLSSHFSIQSMMLIQPQLEAK